MINNEIKYEIMLAHPQDNAEANTVNERGDNSCDKCYMPEIWHNGKTIFELSFCNYFLNKIKLKFIDGKFYSIHGVVDDSAIEQLILAEFVVENLETGVASKVRTLVRTLKLICNAKDFDDCEGEIHVINGMIDANGNYSPEMIICRNRLNVPYNPNAPKPERWLAYINDLLDADDVVTMQEYMGYCLTQTTKGQAMLFIIGPGGEGKSQIGIIMNEIWGDAVYFDSLHNIVDNKFAKANLVGKMALVVDDVDRAPLKDTSFLKSLATSNVPIGVEAKYKQGRQVRIKCRVICFGNELPKSLYDHSDGWSRRLIVISTKPKAPDRVDDPDLASKLAAEKEGILLWAIEGLRHLIKNNYKFTLSTKTLENLEKAKEDTCNIVSFMADEQFVRFSDGSSCAVTDIYDAYHYWCDINGYTPLKIEEVSSWIKTNYAKYGLTYSNKTKSRKSGKYARGYVGINVLFCGR